MHKLTEMKAKDDDNIIKHLAKIKQLWDWWYTVNVAVHGKAVQKWSRADRAEEQSESRAEQTEWMSPSWTQTSLSNQDVFSSCWGNMYGSIEGERVTRFD